MPFHANLHHLSKATVPILCARSNIQRAAIGWDNIRAYNLGLMGYHTPNIDLRRLRTAKLAPRVARRSSSASLPSAPDCWPSACPAYPV